MTGSTSWDDVVVLTHRRLDVDRGGVTATLRRVAEARGFDWRWTLTDAPDPSADAAPLLLCNGGYSLNSGPAVALLARRAAAGRPTIVYWHETSLRMRRLAGMDDGPRREVRGRRRRWRRLQEILVHDRVWHLTVGRGAKSALIALIGEDSRRVFVVRNVVLPTSLVKRRAAPTDELRVCSAGVNLPAKNAAAFADLAARDLGLPLPTRWTWFGDNDVAAASPAVISPGHCVPLNASLVDQDVFLSLSIDEAFNLSALEALQIGMPVVALDAQGIAEVLPDDWVVHCETEVVPVLRRWLQEGWPETGSSRAIASEFTVDAWTAAWEQVLTHVGAAT